MNKQDGVDLLHPSVAKISILWNWKRWGKSVEVLQ